MRDIEKSLPEIAQSQMADGPHWWEVNIALGNGWVSSDNKPLP